MTPVVLSGGSGTRLWPLSRKQRPKQFLPLIGENTLLQETVLRLKGYEDSHAPLIICSEQHRFMMAEQLRQIEQQHQGIILEPEGRNTAPAIALAALFLARQNPQEMMLVLPADHIIHDTQAFYATIRLAVSSAQTGKLVTFGIVPTHPETGYGYIQANTPDDSTGSVNQALTVAQFVEKPDLQTAESYLASGSYFWNSGMFMFRADRYLEELQKYHPEILTACQHALSQTSEDLDFIRIDTESFRNSPDISVDYAVMENTQEATVVPLQAGWNDIGAWPAIWQLGDQDERGNVIQGDAILSDANNNLIHSEQRLVSLLGVDDLVVIDTKDAVLIASQDKAQNIKDIVNQLKQQKRSEATDHSAVDRPWGRYECVDEGTRYQVKRITVNPGATLSLQKHHHRAEHWIVVKGTAEVTCDDKVFLLTENQSTYIPLGSTHRLGNPGKVPLELIEVQSGSYLGEDDIVRFEDNYGRTGTN